MPEAICRACQQFAGPKAHQGAINGAARETDQLNRLIDPGFRLDVIHLVGQRVGVYRPVVDADLPLGVVGPCQRVLHPLSIIAVGIILAGVGAAAFGAVCATGDGDGRLGDEVVVLQRFDEIRVPHQGPVGDADILRAMPDFIDQLDAFYKNGTIAEHGAVLLHHPLHLETQFRGRRAASGEAEAVEAGERRLIGLGRQVGLAARLDHIAAAESGGAAEDDKIDQ